MTMSNSSPSKRPMTAFQILAEPVRVFLIELLCAGEHTSGDLADAAHSHCGVSWSAVSRHLVTLRRSGFVRVIPDGMLRWYCLEEDWLDRIDAEVAHLRDVWVRGEEPRRYSFIELMESPQIRPAEKRGATRGRRARTLKNFAAPGVGRNASAPGLDDTVSFD